MIWGYPYFWKHPRKCLALGRCSFWVEKIRSQFWGRSASVWVDEYHDTDDTTFGWYLLHGNLRDVITYMIGAMVRRALAACAGCYNWVVVGGGSYAGKLWCNNHDIVIGFANPGFTCAIIAGSTRSNLSLKHMNWIGCLKFQHIIYKNTCFIIVVMLALGSRSFVGSRWQATRLDGGRGQEARTSSSLPWPSLRCESQRILIQKNLSLNSDGISILHIKS